LASGECNLVGARRASSRATVRAYAARGWPMWCRRTCLFEYLDWQQQPPGDGGGAGGAAGWSAQMARSWNARRSTTVRLDTDAATGWSQATRPWVKDWTLTRNLSSGPRAPTRSSNPSDGY